MKDFKYAYSIRGLEGTYDTLRDARAMYRWYLKQDGRQSRILRGYKGTFHIIRTNLDTMQERVYSWK